MQCAPRSPRELHIPSHVTIKLAITRAWRVSCPALPSAPYHRVPKYTAMTTEFFSSVQKITCLEPFFPTASPCVPVLMSTLLIAKHLHKYFISLSPDSESTNNRSVRFNKIQTGVHPLGSLAYYFRLRPFGILTVPGQRS